MNNLYVLINISILRMIIYSIFSFIVILFSVILTYRYVLPTIYPALTFLFTLLVSIYTGKKILVKRVVVQINDDILIVDDVKYDFQKLVSYDFNQTEYIYKCSLNFNDKTLGFNVLKKSSNDFIKFKKEIIRKINLLNKEKSLGAKIQIKNWYGSKFSKLYAYFIIFVMLSWFMGMIVGLGNFSWFNFALFSITSCGLLPVLFQIFNQKKG